MDFCGIICEYNPFHNGHAYLINEAKKLTNKKILCLMSGNFVQRGTPAIQNKYERARNAIASGANCVLELPTIFACSNAENFAMGAIKILAGLEIDTIAFGVENTQLSVLEKIADLKVKNSERFVSSFKNEIENGINYNSALKRSIANCLGKEVLEVLNKPNNILAVEYITAIKKLNLKMNIIAVQRCDNGYYSGLEKNEFLSASGIRDLMSDGKLYENFIPKNAKITNFFNKNHEKMLQTLEIQKIRQTPATMLEQFYDYSEGIEYRIKEMCELYGNYDKIIKSISSIRYRTSRVQKLLLYPILGITKSLYSLAKKSKPVCKLLAIDRKDKSLLNSYNKSKINLIITNKDYNSLNKIQSKIIQVDLNASTIYTTITEDRANLDKKVGTLFLD